MASKSLRPPLTLRPRSFIPRLEILETRELPSAGFWSGFAGNAQHTGLSTVPSQPLQTIRWQTPVDLQPQFQFGELLIHYGEIMITQGNTVIVPVKTGAFNGFTVNALDGRTGSQKWSAVTDYILPDSSWTPSFPAVLTPNGRVYFAGPGGTVYYRDHVDSPVGTVHQVAFFGALSTYLADKADYDSTVFIDTPLTSDSRGDIFFGFRVQGFFSPLSTGAQSGYARIDPNGNGTFVGVTDATGDPFIIHDSHNAAPALSNDESTIYVAAKSFVFSYDYLVALDSTTLATKHEVLMHDPRDNNANTSGSLDISSASPVVAPDGTVFYGIFENPDPGSRGFTLHFSADLSTEFTPGGFGWDDTISIVPASMVPSYTGTSSYLIFTKYNNYAFTEDGDGVNRIAILDPNATMVDPHPTADGLLVMNVVMSIVGPTPDLDAQFFYPNAVKEWCINTAAVDPFTDSVFANSEDGNLYRWDLRTNTLSQSMNLAPPLAQAYTPTAIGPDGTVYTINNATLFAVGKALSPDQQSASTAAAIVTPLVTELPRGGVLSAIATLPPAKTAIANEAADTESNARPSARDGKLGVSNRLAGRDLSGKSHSGYSDASIDTASIDRLFSAFPER
jgi:hypothetical protein